MKQVKFRIFNNRLKSFGYYQWNKKDSSHFDWSLLCFEGSGEAYEYGNYGERIKGELQQFTGLRDKNNVEIYEGDILRSHCSDEIHDEGDDLHIGIMEFKNGCFETNNNMLMNLGGTEQMEVIGNIYEDSKLLKAVNS